ncbi:AEC family transporter [bacterium]|nr:AEC family transporter [bacterium]
MFNVVIYAIAPVFILILLGVFLKNRGLLEDTVNTGLSNLVYRVGLPALIFIKVSQSDLKTLWNGKAVALILISTLVIIIILWHLAKLRIKDKKIWGAFVQASYRSNCAIVGFAVIQNHFGEHGLTHASMLLIFIMLIYNSSAVILLNRAGQKHTMTPGLFFKTLFTNPLILALLIALIFSFLKIQPPIYINSALNSLAKMVLPLALISIGAKLRLHISKKYCNEIALATALKLIILPVLQMIIAYLIGIRGELLGVITLMLASPTAVSSYVMAKALGADENLTAQIIVVSTAMAILTMAGFVYWGQISGWF